MRYLAAQFEALFKGDLWLKNARHSNRMAQLLKRELSTVPEVKIVYPVEANGVFAQIPSRAIPKVLQRYFFYPWDIERSVVRWMCSWDTTEHYLNKSVSFVKKTLGSRR